MPRRFNFIGSDADYVDQTGFGIDLEEKPSMQCLDQLFYDLYAQRRFSPGYLFVSKDDIDALTDDIMKNSNFCGPFGPGYPQTDEERPQVHSVSARTVAKICNQTTGRLMDVVPLPGLATGKVIVGFFVEPQRL